MAPRFWCDIPRTIRGRSIRLRGWSGNIPQNFLFACQMVERDQDVHRVSDRGGPRPAGGTCLLRRRSPALLVLHGPPHRPACECHATALFPHHTCKVGRYLVGMYAVECGLRYPMYPTYLTYLPYLTRVPSTLRSTITYLT